MLSTGELYDQVCDYLGTWAASYSIDGIVGDIFAMYPDIQCIDDIDPDEFNEIVQGRDLDAIQPFDEDENY